MENYLGVQYIAPITLGDQALSAVYDTGSFDIMALSVGCKVCESSLQAYNNSTSTTFVSGGKSPAEHEYVSGKVIARQDYESVRVGNGTSPLLAQHMPFWQVMDTDIEIWIKDRAKFSVIVGLGHSHTVPTADGSPSDSVSLLSRVDAKRFAICLERGPENPGWLTINPTWSAATQHLYRTVPVVGKNHWASPLASFEADGFFANLCVGRCVAIIDSGTSMLGVPTSALAAMTPLYDAVDGDCTGYADLPDIKLKIGSHVFVLPPSAYILQISSTISDGQTFRTCLPAFMNVDMATDDGDVWILGMPFLRHFYTVFDREGPSIHVAEQGEGCKPMAEEDSSAMEGANFLNPKGLAVRKLPSLPTMADVRFAQRPMWARGPNRTQVKL